MQPVMIFAVPKTDTRTNASSFKAERSAHLSLSVSSVYSYQIYQIYFPFFESPKKKGKAEPTNKVPNKNIPPINT